MLSLSAMLVLWLQEHPEQSGPYGVGHRALSIWILIFEIAIWFVVLMALVGGLYAVGRFVYSGSQGLRSLGEARAVVQREFTYDKLKGLTYDFSSARDEDGTLFDGKLFGARIAVKQLARELQSEAPDHEKRTRDERRVATCATRDKPRRDAHE